MEAGAVTQWIAATMAGSLYKVLPSTAGGQRPAAGGRSTAKMEATTIPDSSGEVAGPRLGEIWPLCADSDLWSRYAFRRWWLEVAERQRFRWVEWQFLKFNE
ncbi:hypothetical protein CRG98_021157 [Punica granatum]|uniref:Uncharacterized protein n=1 Tax=Punica granatum TaxID=22663 RepID=A0A2I0JQA5_PUNGR|nr:hypothetical protein CRG98_021157 [Punica granatum]